MTEDEAIEKLKNYPEIIVLIVGVIDKGNGNFGLDVVGCVDRAAYFREIKRFVHFKVLKFKKEMYDATKE